MANAPICNISTPAAEKDTSPLPCNLRIPSRFSCFMVTRVDRPLSKVAHARPAANQDHPPGARDLVAKTVLSPLWMEQVEPLSGENVAKVTPKQTQLRSQGGLMPFSYICGVTSRKSKSEEVFLPYRSGQRCLAATMLERRCHCSGESCLAEGIPYGIADLV